MAAGMMLFGHLHPGMEILTTAIGAFLIFISFSRISRQRNAYKTLS
jgi:hypothetical protein